MAKAQPFSFRPSKRLDERLNSLAARTGLSKTAILESLADEAERTRRYPGIAFRGPDLARRAWLLGTSLDVWQVIGELRNFGDDAGRMASETEVPLRQIELAKAYYREFGEEIDRNLALNDRSLEELAREYPFIQQHVVRL
ncbi:MAG: hypothetical protein M3170_04945 [Candidatus Dormibacteraeota bacterium]|nr:hypothetical protein [Candidatus Dormibacteraeota bacterium]